MINGYNSNSDGIVFQENPIPRPYDVEYVQKYDTYGSLNELISNLRLGYVIGSLGFVPASILDVGYGNGAFLRACKPLIENCYGFDISGYPVPEGVEFKTEWLNERVDVLTFFDALEHFVNPYILEKCKAKYIVGSLPWFHNHSDEWFMSWKHRKPNEHLWHFNPDSLANFAYSIGFDLVSFSNVEDVIRIPETKDKNILSFVMKRR